MSRIIPEISKYPVRTSLGDYRVTIKSKYVVLGIYDFRVKIYVKNPKEGRFRRKFRLVMQDSYGWTDYDRWREDLVGLAKQAVKDHEDGIAEDIRSRIAREESLKQFEEWDGIIAEEGD